MEKHIKGFEQFENKEKAEEMREEVYKDIPPCTSAQRKYVYALCGRLHLDPHDLPDYISVKPETRDLNIEEISDVINYLREEAGFSDDEEGDAAF